MRREDFFGKSKYTGIYKAELKNLLGKTESEEIVAAASDIFDTLEQTYPNLLKEEKSHAYGRIFPVIAFYKALKGWGVDADLAVAILKHGAAKLARKKGAAYAAMIRLPGMKRMFLKLFSAGVAKSFGGKAGFHHEILVNNHQAFEFNITKCPYHFYCEKEGCPEITCLFCKNDDDAYGNLPGIVFLRTKTLGTGGDLCDFKFRRQGTGKEHEDVD